MLVNSFTLIDAFNQFWKVYDVGDRRAIGCAGITYFYLCRVWNSTGRSVSFRRQNTLICAELCISKPTLERHRVVLMNYGLISFCSNGKGDSNISYRILELQAVEKSVKKENNFTSRVTSPVSTSDESTVQNVQKRVKKANNITSLVTSGVTSPVITAEESTLKTGQNEFKKANNITSHVTSPVTSHVTSHVTSPVTSAENSALQTVEKEFGKANNITSPVTSHVTSPVTSHVTSHDAYKQSKSKSKRKSTEEELFVVVSGQEKNFHFLKNLFESDPGLQMNFKQKGFLPGNFFDAVRQWMIQNHGSKYHDFEKVRKHFLFWMPNFQILNQTSHEPKPANSNWKTFAKSRKTDLDYAGGL